MNKRMLAAATTGLVVAGSATAAFAATGTGAATGTDGFTPVTQTRVFDSGRMAGDAMLASGGKQVITLPAGLVPAGADAVEIQLTAASETEVSGDLETYPDGARHTPGATSNLNYTRNVHITSDTVVKLGADGKFVVYNHGGTAGSLRLVVDVLGYYAPPAPYVAPAPTSATGSATLKAIGGGWGAGHTVVKSVTLNAGTYLVSLSGDFYKTAPTTATPILQIQLNGTDKQITGYTGAFPYNAAEATGVGSDGSPNGLEQTATAVGVITVAHDGTTVEVDAFGYNADRGSEGGGDFAVNAGVSFTPEG